MSITKHFMKMKIREYVMSICNKGMAMFGEPLTRRARKEKDDGTGSCYKAFD